MPYEVKSLCPGCDQGDVLVIGNWKEHLGVMVCPGCRRMVNVPLESGTCPGCSRQPEPAELFDYSASISDLDGSFPGKLEPGPVCPRCSAERLTFETTSQLAMTTLLFGGKGSVPANLDGKHLERSIFERSLLPVCEELELESTRAFTYFGLKSPADRRIAGPSSFAIAQDIRAHLKFRVKLVIGELPKPPAAESEPGRAPDATPSRVELETPLGTLSLGPPATGSGSEPPEPKSLGEAGSVSELETERPLASTPSAPRTPGESPAVLDLRKKIESILKQRGLWYHQESDRYVLRQGSTQVFILPTQWHDQTVVKLYAPVALDCSSITPELGLRLVELNLQLLFGKFSAHIVMRSIRFEHVLLGDFLDPPELITALEAVAVTADAYGEEISRQAGGRRAIDEGKGRQ